MTSALSRNSTPDALTELLRSVASQDAVALRALYDRTSPQLFGIALRILQRREWAEEVLQEAFVNIWRYAGDYECNRSAPMIWLVAIVRNRALDCLRQQRAFGANAETQWSDAFDDILPASDSEPSDRVLASQEARQLAACMARLRACERNAVVLAYLYERSYDEIADVLNVPIGTVKSQIRRGLKKLRTHLAAV